jgi:hypothetical protein
MIWEITVNYDIIVNGWLFLWKRIAERVSSGNSVYEKDANDNKYKYHCNLKVMKAYETFLGEPNSHKEY